MVPTNSQGIFRFTLVQRLFHAFLLVSFLIQAATGLGRMTMETGWGRGVLSIFGGYDASRDVHIFVGRLMLVVLLIHIIYLMTKVDWKHLPKSLWSQDSLVPRPADVRQFFQHLGWMLGMRKYPEFDRWGYWEKFDYWAVFWGMVVIGGTGLLMTYPFWSTGFMPGWGLNVAFWVHRIEAILAIAHVFIIHFFIAHLRRSSFPMDRAMFSGNAGLSLTRHERSAWVERLEADGGMNALMVPQDAGIVKTVHFVVGCTAVVIGLYLLIGAAISVFQITW
ncbi:MAG: cytochrome C [Desulfobacteraceae bacterium]|nr:cytochrome C [Desulfobacteraceae bacterium]